MFYKGVLVEDIFYSLYTNIEEKDGYINEKDIEFKEIEPNELKKEVVKYKKNIYKEIEKDRKRLSKYNGKNVNDLRKIYKEKEITKLHKTNGFEKVFELDNFISFDEVKEILDNVNDYELDKNKIYSNKLHLRIDGWCDGEDIDYYGVDYIIYCIEDIEINDCKIELLAIRLAIYNNISIIFKNIYPSDLKEYYQSYIDGDLTFKGFAKKLDPRNSDNKC